MNLVVAIIGPTASGKSTFAVEIAEKTGGEIICVDSTTIYQGFDIGSSKPTAEERKKVPHHLVDVVAPEADFSAGKFVKLAEEAIRDVTSRGKIPILVGGSYFYLRALQHGMYPVHEVGTEILEEIERTYSKDDTLDTDRLHADLAKADPEAAKQIHPNDRYRLLRAMALWKSSGVKPSSLKPEREADQTYWLKYAIGISRHTLNQAIAKRTDTMLAAGLVNETKALLEKHPNSRALGSIGYAETVSFLLKRITEKQLRTEIIEKTRQLAKRQVTWLRSDHEVRYVDFGDKDRVLLEISNLKFVFEGSAACNQ